MRPLVASLFLIWSLCGMAGAAGTDRVYVERAYSIVMEAEISGISFFFNSGNYADGGYFNNLTYAPDGPFQSHLATDSWFVDVDERYAVGTLATIRMDVDRRIYEHILPSGEVLSEVLGHSSSCTVVVHCQFYGWAEPPGTFQPAFSINNGANLIAFDLDNNLLVDMPDTNGIGWFSDAMIPDGDPEWMTISWFISSYDVTTYDNQVPIASAPLPAPAWMLLASVGLLGLWRRGLSARSGRSPSI